MTARFVVHDRITRQPDLLILGRSGNRLFLNEQELDVGTAAQFLVDFFITLQAASAAQVEVMLQQAEQQEKTRCLP
jgi:hypothetical protein